MSPTNGVIPTIYEGTYEPPLGATHEEWKTCAQQGNSLGDLQVIKALPTLQDLLTTSAEPGHLSLLGQGEGSLSMLPSHFELSSFPVSVSLHIFFAALH